jgi:hypothetical protein
MLVAHQRGTMGDLVPLIEQQASEAPLLAYQSALAMAHADADRVDEARRLLSGFVTTGCELPLDTLWCTSMVSWVEAAIVVGDPELAAPLYDQLEPWADQWATMGSTTSGPVSYYLGGLAAVLGRYDDADAHLARSAAFSRRVGATFVATRTDLLWGAMLAERDAPGDADRARELLDRARDAAATRGYATVERRAADARRRLA